MRRLVNGSSQKHDCQLGDASQERSKNKPEKLTQEKPTSIKVRFNQFWFAVARFVDVRPMPLIILQTSGWLNLAANVIDNFTHGLAVAGSYQCGIKVGRIWATSTKPTKIQTVVTLRWVCWQHVRCCCTKSLTRWVTLHSSSTPASIAGRPPKRSSSLLPVAFSALSSHSPRLQPKALVIKLSFPWSFAACGFTYAVVVVVARQRDGLGTSLHSRWLPLYRARHCRSRSDEGDESIVSVKFFCQFWCRLVLQSTGCSFSSENRSSKWRVLRVESRVWFSSQQLS